MVWALGMIPKFTDFRIVVQRSIIGLGGSEPEGERILILVGEQDVLMDVRMMRRLAMRYRDAVKQWYRRERGKSCWFRWGQSSRHRDLHRKSREWCANGTS
jgi:hypothetical protein